MKTIGFFRVVVEPLNKSSMPPQCYRCQEFFHHSRFCARAPKCLKCSGGHLTSECTKPAKAQAKCAIAGAPPCKLLRMPQKSHQHKNNNKTRRRSVGRAAAARREKQSTKPTFAEVVKRPQNNESLDAKEMMTQMAQMMAQWGQMLSILQTKF
ncbi:nucleic-acid-binding protein from transposon X-element [Trichonephila inaurata madagascariensis]|uniref:Nucleic-acid-binding protein from transposon X-element n=1 Tax=Trichonephila inaurata madagascariensis TaxID=2747483 RepID=A0A8X7CHC3_9ARAC|nr:nucleic-acid-binding protein from transposon X-element [Trichonephila inaurata madagascariensis]